MKNTFGNVVLLVVSLYVAPALAHRADTRNVRIAQLSPACVHLGQDGVELAGVVQLDRAFGPPGWGDNPREDEIIHVPILHLYKPVHVCVDSLAGLGKRTRIIRAVSGWSEKGKVSPGAGLFTGRLEASVTISQITDYVFQVEGANYYDKTKKSRHRNCKKINLIFY